MTTGRRATLVVIEYGGVWPRWLAPSARATGDVAVVAQHYEGEPMSLVTQVASRITRLEQRGWKLDTVVLVSNGRSDIDARAARAVLARGLLARMHQARVGNLVLSVDEREGERAQRAIEALAHELNVSSKTPRPAPVALAS